MFYPKVLLTALLVFSAAAIGQPANAQTVKTAVQPAYMKFRAVNPSFIPNLAAIRQINLRVNHGAGFKNRLVKKHIRSMIPPRYLLPIEEEFDKPDENSIASEFLPVAFSSRNKYCYIKGPVASVETHKAKAWARTFVAVDQATNEKFAGNASFFAKDQVLILSTADHEFQIDRCKVSLKRGSLVLVHKTANGFQLINIKDDCRDSVQIFSPAAKLAVKPGTEASVELCQSSKTSRTDGIGRRNKQTHCDCDDCKLHIYDISLHSVILNNSLLNHMYNSEKASDRKLCGQVLKMAAVLAHLNRSNVEYSWK